VIMIIKLIHKEKNTRCDDEIPSMMFLIAILCNPVESENRLKVE